MNTFFSVSDRVICVDSSHGVPGTVPAPLVEGKSYTISKMQGCRCGDVKVHVGLKSVFLGNSKCKCGVEFDFKSYDFWHSQTRFIKPETDQALQDEIFESLKGKKELI